ncbi:TetR/AcrR family transcriptional regulator [Deinococcus cellulosilyticus]|uniref:TetR family transcriptional regulator n=1 Tax=Deinococcus cellulosilyticus (strain DSM 18568 / NBRC 106333 / KACC 11606 / 5516J-15) TaxID=1223518 RepID=A0A511N7R2_DEIC1|nr:TetR/AcrR family transcriptional regulator [Deinococcus cellulosilyticus]GEM48506.1 TetR family transcriptional regulator [Deinococcus cellulosilyticus NBRC 106333 = KACC 11606]
MPRKGLDREQVLDAAEQIANQEGLQALTIARLAAALNIKPPSLYNHIESLDQLIDGLTVRGMRMMIDLTRDAAAGKSCKDALCAVAHVHRNAARTRPGLYTATQVSVQKFGPEAQELAGVYLQVILSVLQGYHLEEEQALHAVRILRALLKGFIDLELGGGFGMPLKIDETFQVMLDTFDAGLRRTGG